MKTDHNRQSLHTRRGQARHDQRGEGVISTAIAVLIVAFLAVGLWATFNTMFKDVNSKTADQIENIGNDSP